MCPLGAQLNACYPILKAVSEGGMMWRFVEAFQMKRDRMVFGAGLLLALMVSGSPLALAVSVDVNQASVQQLQTVKGIGAKTAERIVQERARGKFESLAHLSERLSGIGPKTLIKLKAAGLCAGSSSQPCADAQSKNEPRVVRQAMSSAKSNGKVATPEVIQIP